MDDSILSTPENEIAMTDERKMDSLRELGPVFSQRRSLAYGATRISYDYDEAYMDLPSLYDGGLYSDTEISYDYGGLYYDTEEEFDYTASFKTPIKPFTLTYRPWPQYSDWRLDFTKKYSSTLDPSEKMINRAEGKTIVDYLDYDWTHSPIGDGVDSLDSVYCDGTLSPIVDYLDYDETLSSIVDCPYSAFINTGNGTRAVMDHFNGKPEYISRNIMEMLLKWFSFLGKNNKPNKILFGTGGSLLPRRSDQDDPISLPPDSSTSTSVEQLESEVDVELGLGLRNTTERTSPISINASSENPEEGDGTETPHEIQQLNNSPEHFGTIILLFIFELVFYAMRDTDHNHSSSSNWHSYYFGATTAVSFITTLCAIYLRPKHKVAARILQKIGVMTAASGVIVALFNLFLPGNIIWIGFLASLIVNIVVTLA